MYYLNHKNNKRMVTEINNSPIKASFMEIGAGIEVASSILSQPNASQTVLTAESIYSKEAQKEYIKSTSRSVGIDFVDKALSVLEESTKNLNKNTNFISSFQLPNKKGHTNHGWIGLKYKGVLKFYHTTLPQYSPTRESLIKDYGTTGLKILWSRNAMPLLKEHYVDAVYDESGNGLLKETVQAIHSSFNSGIVLKKLSYGIEIERVESILRDKKKVILFKGSFNPIHKGHRVIMKSACDKFKDTLYSKAYVMSYSNRDKDTITPDEMTHRIYTLLDGSPIGTNVLLFKKPSFHDLIEFIGDRAPKDSLVFPMGVDTLKRIKEDLDIPSVFSRAQGLIFDRSADFNRKAFFKDFGSFEKNIIFEEDHKKLPHNSSELRK